MAPFIPLKGMAAAGEHRAKGAAAFGLLQGPLPGSSLEVGPSASGWMVAFKQERYGTHGAYQAYQFTHSVTRPFFSTSASKSSRCGQWRVKSATGSRGLMCTV